MLEVQKLSYSYNGKDNLIHDISFALTEGDFLCVAGLNGCGKTTLLKAMSNILKPGGSIKINGENILKMKRREISQKISYFQQRQEYLVDLSVSETVMLGRYPYMKGVLSPPSAEDRDIVADVLCRVGLYENREESICRLSGGQVQRVFLAQIMAQDADVMLLDEPTNHLDLKYRIDFLNYIRQYAEKPGKTIVCAVHDLNMARQYANKVLLLSGGTIVKYGRTEDVLDSRELNDVYGINVKKYMRKNFGSWVGEEDGLT